MQVAFRPQEAAIWSQIRLGCLYSGQSSVVIRFQAITDTDYNANPQ